MLGKGPAGNLATCDGNSEGNAKGRAKEKQILLAKRRRSIPLNEPSMQKPGIALSDGVPQARLDLPFGLDNDRP
jgi:hypothetical protein